MYPSRTSTYKSLHDHGLSSSGIVIIAPSATGVRHARTHRLYIQEIDNGCFEFVRIVGPVAVDFPTETADHLPVFPAPIVDSGMCSRESIVRSAMKRRDDLAARCFDAAHVSFLLELPYDLYSKVNGHEP